MSMGLIARARAMSSDAAHHLLSPTRNQKATGRSSENTTAQRSKECLNEKKLTTIKNARTPAKIPTALRDLEKPGIG
jgi:hypothetical protein